LIVAAVLALGTMRHSSLYTGILLLTHPDWKGITLSQVWKVSALIFWGICGLGECVVLEEFRDPQRTIKRVYLASFAVVIVLNFLLAATH
jgi:amino acid transporter